MVILNHARDVHNAFARSGPSVLFPSPVEDVNGWKLPANAMEVFNSGSTQTDATQLFTIGSGS